jgi:hypothetical protein
MVNLLKGPANDMLTGRTSKMGQTCFHHMVFGFSFSVQCNIKSSRQQNQIMKGHQH